MLIANGDFRASRPGGAPPTRIRGYPTRPRLRLHKLPSPHSSSYFTPSTMSSTLSPTEISTSCPGSPKPYNGSAYFIEEPQECPHLGLPHKEVAAEIVFDGETISLVNEDGSRTRLPHGIDINCQLCIEYAAHMAKKEG